MMRLKSAGAAIVLSCLSMLSACEFDQADPIASGGSSAVAAIGESNATLIGATSDPCKLVVGDPFWRLRGGQEGNEQRCGHSPPD